MNNIRHQQSCTPLVFAISTLLLLPSSLFGEAPRDLRDVTLVGQLVNHDGQPTKGRVQLHFMHRGTLEVTETETKDDGTFALDSVSPVALLGMQGKLHEGRLIAFAEGYAPLVLAPPIVSPGTQFDLKELRLSKGTALTGQVVLPSGKPAIGADISVNCYGFYFGNTLDGIMPPLSFKADEAGHFETSPLPACHISVEAKMDGFRSGFSRTLIDGSLNEIGLHAIRLEEEYPVAGVVAKADGTPIKGARVTWDSNDVLSDERGRFRLRGLGPDYQIQVVARKEGFREHRQVHSSEPALQIRLRPVHYLQFRAVDKDSGEQVELTQAILCNYETDEKGNRVLTGCQNPAVERGDEGSLQIMHFGPYAYHLLLKASGYDDFESYLPMLKNDGDHDIGVVEMQRVGAGNKKSDLGQSVVGTVNLSAVKAQTAMVSLWSVGPQIKDRIYCPVHFGRIVTSPPRFTAVVGVNPDKSFEIEVPSQGDWYLRMDIPDSPPTIVGPISISQGEPQEFELTESASATIVGKTDAPNLDWGCDWRAIAFTEQGFIRTTQLSRDGHFEFDNLPPGKYGLKLGHTGFRDREVDVWNDRLGKEPANPWSRALTVELVGGERKAVEVPFHRW